MMDDAELLSRYAGTHAEEAFAELVQRHVNLVYRAALRQLGGDAHGAQEVAQAVFTLLARKAGSLTGHTSLAGWLYSTTHFTVRDLRRGERRRLAREQEAFTMQELATDSVSAADWERLRPVLDDAMQGLGDADREALLLRFFEEKPFAEVGEKLAVSEDAARMRVERALDKLHGLLAKRGVTSTAAAVGLMLANEASVAAPAGLAAAVTGSALAGAATAAGGGAIVAAKVFTFMSTTKIMAGVAGVIAVAATAVTWQQRQANAELRTEIGALREQTAAVTTLRAENQRLVAAKNAGDDTARAEHEELVQLRAARDAFRKRLAQGVASGQAVAPATATTAAPGDGLKPGMVSVDVLQDVGRDTPRAAAQSMMAAAQRGEVDKAASCLTFDPAERAKLEAFIATLPENLREKYRSPEVMMASVISGSPKPVSGVKLLSETRPDADTAVQEVQVQYQSGEVRQDEITFRRDTDGWKQVVSPAMVDRVVAYFKGKQ